MVSEVRQLRVERGLSQARLAQELGVSRQTTLDVVAVRETLAEMVEADDPRFGRLDEAVARGR